MGVHFMRIGVYGMNDIERAIETLKMENELMQFDPMTGEIEPIELQNQDNQDLYNANLVAISALEKQIPEKPYYLNYGGCNVGNWNHGIACICDYKAPYCRHCGQRLDWEVEND